MQEILATIKKNKMRTFLTGVLVAWGIFMLMIAGFQETVWVMGVAANSWNDAVNACGSGPGKLQSLPGNEIRKTNSIP